MGKWMALVVFLWLIMAAAIGYIFINGTAVPGADGRRALQLNGAEKQFVLKEMRRMLEAVQGIVAGLEDKDMKGVALAATPVGMAAMRGVPVSIMAKLPREFRKLGSSLHKGFDLIALEAEGIGDRDKLLSLLSQQLGRCVACHSSFSLK